MFLAPQNALEQQEAATKRRAFMSTEEYFSDPASQAAQDWASNLFEVGIVLPSPLHAKVDEFDSKKATEQLDSGATPALADFDAVEDDDEELAALAHKFSAGQQEQLQQLLAMTPGKPTEFREELYLGPPVVEAPAAPAQKK